MAHNRNSSGRPTAGLNKRYKGDKGAAGERGFQGETGLDGLNGPVELTINIQAASYILALADTNSTLVAMTSATPNVLTIPPNSDVPFEVGEHSLVVQDGAGATTIAGGAGVTLISVNNFKKIGGRYGSVALVQKAINVWYLIGNLDAT